MNSFEKIWDQVFAVTQQEFFETTVDHSEWDHYSDLPAPGAYQTLEEQSTCNG